MGASENWGKAHANNTNGFGKATNTNSWGKVKESTESGETDLKDNQEE